MGKITTVSFPILLSISFFLCSGHVLIVLIKEDPVIVFYFRHEHFTSYELSAGGYPGFHGMKRLGVLLISLIGSPVTCHLSPVHPKYPSLSSILGGLLDTFS